MGRAWPRTKEYVYGCQAIQRGIKRSGFMINHEKSIEGQLLGFIIDLKEGTFKVPNHRVENLKILSDKVTEKKCYTTAREVAKVTGSIISMSLALGPVARLWTRALYRNSSSVTTWDRKIILSIEGQKGINFGPKNLTVAMVSQSGKEHQK